MGTSAASRSPRTALPERRALAVACVASLAVAVDIAWFDGADASLQTSLGFGASGASAALAAYALGSVVSLFVSGTLYDRHGSRWLILVGTTLLLVATVMSTAATGPAMIVAGRLIAGTGAGSLSVSALVVIAAAYRETERTKPYSIVAASAAAAYVLVPTLAGFLIGQSYWRVTPLVVLPALAALALLVSSVRPGPASMSHRVDLVGLVTIVAATTIVYVAVSIVPSSGIDVRTLAAAAVAGLLVGAFVRRERRLGDHGRVVPLIELSLFANPTFAGAVAVGGLVRVGTGAAFLFIVQLSQYVVGLSALVTQLALIPAAILGVSGDLVSPAVERRLGTGGTIATGALALAVAYVGLMVTTAQTYAIAFIAVAIAAFGYELTVAPLNRAVVAATDDHGRAVSAANTVAKLSSIIGLAVVTALFLAVYGDRLGEELIPRELATTLRLTQTPSPASISSITDQIDVSPRVRARFESRSSDAFLAAQRIAFLIPAISAVVGAAIALRTIRPACAKSSVGQDGDACPSN